MSLLPSRLRELALKRSLATAPERMPSPVKPDAHEPITPSAPEEEHLTAAPTPPSPAPDPTPEPTPEPAPDASIVVIDTEPRAASPSSILSNPAPPPEALPEPSVAPSSAGSAAAASDMLVEVVTTDAEWSSASAMAQNHKLRELRTMALEHNVSQVGTKVELCERILTARAAAGDGPPA